MIFNSLDFFIFLPICLILYYLFRKNLKVQNFLLVVASYFFYGYWDYRFLSLIAFSTIVDYIAGQQIQNSESKKRKKAFLILSLLTNLGLLGVFKYYNFFVESFIELFAQIGYQLPSSTLEIILPVGISFYTFQTLSYTIDIYREKIKPTRDFIAFAAFVSFFPQLVAGPIERAAHLLPQFFRKREVQYRDLIVGSQMLVWGLFKKVAVADNLAEYVNIVYGNQDDFGGLNNIIATIFFAFQIYCDFSGYSTIAIGLARMFGFELNQNFNTPYFALSIREFWQRWHISLSTWFRDYVYISLGGNRKGPSQFYKNIMITFLISGFWHGANWTFIVWGGIHGGYYLIENSIKDKLKLNENIQRIFGWLLTFVIACLAWIFFRADSVYDAYSFLLNSFSLEHNYVVKPYNLLVMSMMTFILIFFDWAKKQSFFQKLYRESTFLRWGFYYLIILLIFLFGNTQSAEFIYFQF